MLNAIVEIVDYISYYLSGTTRHGLHSPFVYNFADHVLYQSSDLNFEMIENQRLNMIKSRSSNNKSSLSKIAANQVLDSKYGRLLQRMLAYYHPKSVLEIGNHTGIETNYILSNWAMKNQPLQFYGSVENDPYFQKVKQETLSSFVSHYQSDSFQFIDSGVPQKNQLIDLIVIYGDQDSQNYWKFYDQYKPHLGTQSMLVLTNIRYSNDHFMVWCQMTHLKEVTASIELFNMGILFFRTEQQQQKFILRY